jgi:hypothetical protein
MSGKIQEIVTRTRSFIDGLTRPPEFTCGDCERYPQCGLPPDADCVEKALQRERDPDGWMLRAKRRAPYMLDSISRL